MTAPSAQQPMTPTRLRTLKRFEDGPSGTDGLFDRNCCSALEDLGYLEYISGCSSGERSYRITKGGLEALKTHLKGGGWA